MPASDVIEAAIATGESEIADMQDLEAVGGFSVCISIQLDLDLS